MGVLDAKVNAMFDRKLAQLDARASVIVRDMGKTKEMFFDACNAFYGLDAEPDTEDMWSPNINAIKSQKGVYALALKKAMEGMRLEADAAQNKYEKYAAILANVKNANTELLKINARYRIVVHCYSGHLRNFKRCASELERLIKATEKELAGKSKELGEYNEVMKHIAALKSYKADLRLLEDRRSSLNQERPAIGGEQEIGTALAAKRAELSSVRSQASALHERIRGLVAPLERAAKKFDHISASKKQLYSFMSDPVSAINDKAEYLEFVEMAKGLKESISTGKVDVKNREVVEAAAHLLLESNVYDMLEAYRSMESSKSALEVEVARLETEKKYMASSRASTERAAQDADRLQASINETRRLMDAAKAATERLISAYYGKSLSIIT